MVLRLDNIGGIKINGVLYRATSHEWIGDNRIYKISTGFGSMLHPEGIPNEEEWEMLDGLPVLEIDDRVYIEGSGVKPGTDGDLSTFSGGCYLETVTNTYRFYHAEAALNDGGTEWEWRRDTSPTDTVSFRCLGYRPASYSGGLKISGLSIPTWNNRVKTSQTINTNIGTLYDVVWKCPYYGNSTYPKNANRTFFANNVAAKNRSNSFFVMCEARENFATKRGTSNQPKILLTTGTSTWVGGKTWTYSPI